MVAIWCEEFAPASAFQAIVVEADGQLVAALPLIATRWLGMPWVSQLGNAWSPAGGLLLAEDTDRSRISDLLADTLTRQGWNWLRCDGVPDNSAAWEHLASSLALQHKHKECQTRFNIDVVEIGTTWQEYLQGRSRNLRRQLKRATMMADALGSASLRRNSDLSSEKVEPLLRRCFELEAAGWKGRSGGAALSTPKAWRFYARQAQCLANWQQLQINELQLQGRTIAFEYGWLAKQRYCSLKVGYDESLGRLSPGQMLRAELLETFFACPASDSAHVDTFDFLGPTSRATREWGTASYSVDRWIVALGGKLSQTALHAGMRAKQLIRSWRNVLRTCGAAEAAQGAAAHDSEVECEADQFAPLGSGPK